MVQFHKQADGTWKRFGEPLSSEEEVCISLGNSGEPGSVLMGSDVEGEYSYAEAVALVEGMIRDNTIGKHNVIMIYASVNRIIEDGFTLGQRDLVARHPEWLQTGLPPLPPKLSQIFYRHL